MALVIWMKISKTVGFFFLFRYLYTVYRVRLQPYIFTFIFKATFFFIHIECKWWNLLENDEKWWKMKKNADKLAKTLLSKLPIKIQLEGTNSGKKIVFYQPFKIELLERGMIWCEICKSNLLTQLEPICWEWRQAAIRKSEQNYWFEIRMFVEVRRMSLLTYCHT